jgi:hypothetical protein
MTLSTHDPRANSPDGDFISLIAHWPRRSRRKRRPNIRAWVERFLRMRPDVNRLLLNRCGQRLPFLDHVGVDDLGTIRSRLTPVNRVWWDLPAVTRFYGLLGPTLGI